MSYSLKNQAPLAVILVLFFKSCWGEGNDVCADDKVEGNICPPPATELVNGLIVGLFQNPLLCPVLGESGLKGELV